jgi:hypothetical protein
MRTLAYTLVAFGALAFGAPARADEAALAARVEKLSAELETLKAELRELKAQRSATATPSSHARANESGAGTPLPYAMAPGNPSAPASSPARPVRSSPTFRRRTPS